MLSNEKVLEVIAAVERMQKINDGAKGISLDWQDEMGYADACEGAFNEVRDAIETALRAQADAQPIYQLRRSDGSWIDQTERSYLNNQQHCASETRIVYTHPAPEAAQAGLSDAEIFDLWCSIPTQGGIDEDIVPFARALLARASAATVAEPACKTCNGSGFIDDGEITGSGGVEYENGPVKCITDCPNCGGKKQAEPMGDEREAAESAYNSPEFNYERGPIGSHDWRFYSAGWRARATRAAQSGQRAAWFAALMEAAAALENAMYCMQDKDAARSATGAAEFARKRAKELFAAQSGQRAGVAEDARDAARYRFIRATTKAVRNDDGSGRTEVTPEEFDAITDAAIAAAPTPAAQGGGSHD